MCPHPKKGTRPASHLSSHDVSCMADSDSANEADACEREQIVPTDCGKDGKDKIRCGFSIYIDLIAFGHLLCEYCTARMRAVASSIIAQRFKFLQDARFFYGEHATVKIVDRRHPLKSQVVLFCVSRFNVTLSRTMRSELKEMKPTKQTPVFYRSPRNNSEILRSLQSATPKV